ncbi:uncharacterized protein LOC126285059 [Schistocerca gregaria]|uniref:uncharacterized protein LOC126285059 n=1 Tax=Schistocerca gregaria TaxID=7010 RepID=UPI00211E8AF1|nr:uncharacterized protein LOC126285059 [Schistocerca gregaria]
MDENGCRLALHKSPDVLAKKGVKCLHFVASEHWENVTIVSCGNAIGQVIPPTILFKGKRRKPEWGDYLPLGAAVEMTDKGSMNTATFIKWIHHFAKYKPAKDVILTFDAASSHLDPKICDVAEEHYIRLYCLPTNTTHELQPMDKSVFKLFESYWDDEVQLYWSTREREENRSINRRVFGKIFSKVWPKAASPVNVMAGFRATGIYPFDPEAIPDTAFAPSRPSERPDLEEDMTIAPETGKLPETQSFPKPFRKKGRQSIDYSSSESEAYSVKDSSSDFSLEDSDAHEVKSVLSRKFCKPQS